MSVQPTATLSRAGLSRPAVVRAAGIALLPGLFPPPPTTLDKRVRRALLLLLTFASTSGAVAWLAFSRDLDLRWPLAMAIVGVLAAAAIPWHDLAPDSFEVVGIACAAWVAYFVWLTGGERSAQSNLAIVPVIVIALGASPRVALPLAIGAAALPILPFLYGAPSPREVEQIVTLFATCLAFAIGSPFLMREARAAVEIERVSSKRSEYYSVVAHELRNPLIGISSMSRVLARQLHGSPQVQHIQAMEAEANAALALLDGLSDIASIESGRLRLALHPLELCGVVREIAGAAQSSEHPVVVSGIDMPVMVLGDDRRIAQVLRNLLSNAAKFAPEDTPIDVSVSVERRQAVVRVRDAGPGLPPAERPQLFQKFTRLSTAGGTLGSGLGLYISRMIARDHGGDLWAEWPDDGGSVFSFSIPLAT